MYGVLVAGIITGAVYSYKFLDFGGKTTIFFKIVAGDQNMMRMPPKPAPGNADFRPPEGFRGGERREFRPGAERFGHPGEQGAHGPFRGKGMHGKPGAGNIISLRNVIPYAFILAFFILVTRALDVSIRKKQRVGSSD